VKSVTREEVTLRSKTRNNYLGLSKKVKEALTSGKVDLKKEWTMQETEEAVYKALGSKARKHVSAKYALAKEIAKHLTETLGMATYCKFSQPHEAFFISNARF